ncbi:MAG: tyrosine-type recombinase/integrase [Geodermatophilaceae bacterium]
MLWLADLELRGISENTKENYRDDLRLHVRPYYEHYTLGEITTGRVEWFLKSERAVSYSRAKHSRTVLNQIFTFALRHDAMQRNPVGGTSPLTKPKNQIQALTLEQVQAIRAAAAAWRTGPGVKGPKPDGQVRDAIEVLLGTSMRPGEALALRPCDIVDGKPGTVAHVRGTVVYQQGRGTFRQDHPKTDASVRQVPVPEFAAQVLRLRIALLGPEERGRTIFANRNGGPLSQHNFRRTFREFLVLAGLESCGITPRWYRRTGATVLARGLGVDVAAAHLGHTSNAITVGHYIEPDRTINFGPADVLEATLRPVDPDGALLARPETDEEDRVLDQIDPSDEADPADVA